MKEMYTAGALFAGIGGLCKGFATSGIRTAWAVENDESAVQTYQANFRDTRVIKQGGLPADIRNISVSKDKLENVDVLHAGFPCQSFSVAGDQRGFNDDRGELFYEVIRIVKEFGEMRPSVLVLENSPNLKGGDGGAWFIEITKEIKKAGYWFRDSNSAELDPYLLTKLPQQRNRLFMVALSTNSFRNGRIEFPQKMSCSPKNLEEYVDFSGSLSDETYYLPKENRYHKLISKHIDEPKAIYQLRKYFVRAKDPNVCPTLTANMGLGGHNVPFILDKKGLRKLTEYECLALQGFSKKFRFPESVSRAKRYVQIGNSVCAPIARLLSKVVYSKIQKDRLK